MGGVGIACYLADDAHGRVGTKNIVGNGIGNFLRPAAGVGEVVFAVVLMHPGRLGEIRHINPVYLTVCLRHVVLQLGAVALAVAPNDISRAVIIYQDGGVDAGPTVLRGEAFFVGEQGFPQGIPVGAGDLVCDCHTDAAPVSGDVPVIPAVLAFGYMSGVCLFAVSPPEIIDVQWRRVFRPVLHVGGGVEQPVLHHISCLVAGGIVSGKEPQRVVFHECGRIGCVFVPDDGIAVRFEFVPQHIAPLLLQALQFLFRHRDNRTVTGEEVLAERLRFAGECLQILRCLVFVATGAVEVVHKDVFVPSVQLKHSATLHTRPRASIGINILEILLIRSRQFFRRCLLDAVLYFLAVLVLRVALIEQVEDPVFLDDVGVYAAVFGGEQHLRLALESSKVLVGVGVVGDECLAVVALQREVYHVLPGLAVVDGLWRPHPVGIAEMPAPVLREIDFRVRPVHQILRLQQHDARVCTPALLRVVGVHIRCHDVVAPVLTAQDVRVAYASALADAVAGNNRSVAVQRVPVPGVFTHGEAQLLHQLLVSPAFEVGEEVAGERRVRCFGCAARQHQSPKHHQ